MARVLTFAKYYPNYHHRAGELTYFEEKIWNSIGYSKPYSSFVPKKTFWYLSDCRQLKIDRTHPDMEPKHHTVRAGKRWKVGDKFSPRIWSGKPYRSKQLKLTEEDQTIKKIWDLSITLHKGRFQFRVNGHNRYLGLGLDRTVSIIAKNDGLNLLDFLSWFIDNPSFVKHLKFEGQIICWHQSVEY